MHNYYEALPPEHFHHLDYFPESFLVSFEALSLVIERYRYKISELQGQVHRDSVKNK